MQVEQIKELYDYDHWANERLWQAIVGLSQDQLNMDMHNGLGDMLDTLLHMINAMRLWRIRWQGGTITNMLTRADFPTLQSMRTRWQEEEEQVHHLLTTLHDEDIIREFRYVRTTTSQAYIQPLWKTMHYLTNHQTQHRSEIAMQLTAFNQSPGELSMNFFFDQ